jgi:long-chain acyl-CoA synthetase
MFEQAALGLGLVVVPLYVNDRPDNVAYILNDAGVKLLLLENQAQWQELLTVASSLDDDLHVWSLESFVDTRVHSISTLVKNEAAELITQPDNPEALATIVYTSGTTGKPKGVMLSHHNILWNAHAGLQAVAIYPSDIFLSFLPLSHTLERTIGYYLPMMAGAAVAHGRSIQELPHDLAAVKPTVLISVPRIYERSYARIIEKLKSPMARFMFNLAVQSGWARFLYSQNRAGWNPVILLWPIMSKLVAEKVMEKLGGRLRIAMCGGAPLAEDVARVFIGLGLNLLQGYGMTESSPVISTNVTENNDPAGVGPLFVDTEARIGKDDELQVRSPGVMMGYWNRPQETHDVVDDEGWLHSGDKASIENGHVYIIGRIKEVLVLANGEKVPPADMEMAITADPLFEQAMVIGDNRPTLAALLVLNEEEVKKRGWSSTTEQAFIHDVVMPRVSECIKTFPGYAQIKRVAVISEPWTVENDLLTPTLKLKRNKIIDRYNEAIEGLYKR